MERRAFLQTTGTILAGAAIAPTTLTSSQHAPSAGEATGRMVLSMNRKWRYTPSMTREAARPEFDDSQFESVCVPHTNVRLPWHSFDEKLSQFVSTYRRRFRLPPQARGSRVFVDFEGVMTASTVWLNGQKLGEYKGGYPPFWFELTRWVNLDGENVLTVYVDSTERADIPPFGHEIDYLTFGGIYREVALRIVPQTFIENIFAKPKDVLNNNRSIDVDCYLVHGISETASLRLQVSLEDVNGRVLSQASRPITFAQATDDPVAYSVSLTKLDSVKLWDLDSPHLYTVNVRLLRDGRESDQDSRQIGVREATFTDHGFKLNGKIIKLRGLDRHQTFPFVGQAMPKRVQRQDAIILRKKLKINIVRTSHYLQSRHFLDCCDEIGLLVLEEIPGWQHIGPDPWKLLSIDNVRRMIRRDWNHPSIILWGVRINESIDDHDFYLRTNKTAHDLDPTRQTGGIRYFQSSEFLEDVFTMNDFGFPLKPPNHPRYLNTEFVGHTFPTKTTDDDERQREHTLRHARIHDQLASNPQYAGGIGWCAFDYNTHANFGAGDRVCYHGVTDIFREPKAAAGFYKSQCDPADEIVLEPAFHWAASDESVGFTRTVVCSNCDHLKWYIRDEHGERLVAETGPDRSEFPHLRYPPFQLDMSKVKAWGDLRIEGFIAGKSVISKSLSGKGYDQNFSLVADDNQLVADGADATRVVFRVTDEFGNVRPYANDPITFELHGPAELIGNKVFSLVGGTGAIWIRAQEVPGTVTLSAMHPYLGIQQLQFEIMVAAPESV